MDTRAWHAAGRAEAALVGAANDDEVLFREAIALGIDPALRDVPQQTWVGPLRSSYGLHLVWVRGRVAGRVPPVAAVRSHVLHRLMKERGEERAHERMRELRARYDVRVETALE